MRREQVARIVMLRGLGYSTEDIGNELDPAVTRSCVAKNLRSIRDRAKEGNPEMVFSDMLFSMDEMDQDSLIALGNSKFTYKNLIHGGFPPSKALEIARASPNYADEEAHLFPS